MRIYSDILGAAADFHDALHRLEHEHAVDVLHMAQGDLSRRRLRATTDGGTEIAIALSRDQKLFDGAVLALSEDAALVVRVEVEHWLTLRAADQVTALKLGYFCGNLHWRVRFEGDAVLVAVDTEERFYLDRLEPMLTSGVVHLVRAPDAQTA